MIWLLACAVEGELTADGVRVSDRADLVELRRAGSEQPVSGTWSGTTFRPVVPLEAGTWEAELRDGQVLTLVVEAEALPEPEVLDIRPGGVVPANLLGFHVRFDQPVGVPVERRLLGPDGEDAQAFAETWLWSEDRSELNLLLHPGRTKTDIPFAEDLGPNLIEGSSYTLVVHGHEHAFEVGPPDHTRPLPEDWRVQGDTLILDEVMRSDLLVRAFEIEGATGEFVAEEDRLRFVGELPEDAVWVQVGRVEDLAGNTPTRTFDAPADEALRQDPPPTRFSERR